MQNPRFHGNPPYITVAVHGGPGARGSAWPIAHALGRTIGVLEPMQAAVSMDGQAEELRDAIIRHCIPPVVMIGHSWGAWLAFILAARNPELVSKLILAGSGPFLESYAEDIMEARLGRLSAVEAAEARGIMARLGDSPDGVKNELFTRIGALMEKADTYAPAPPGEPFETEMDSDANTSVWAEAAELRRSGALLKLARDIRCPVLAIHGDYDPHPWQGVKVPLEERIKDFRMILLDKCGHEPWNELYAKDKFFDILRKEAKV